ncbi:MAG: DUF1345 domain-containing protein [Chloroflexota bacterium]|jgi:uncharacterized membrane protein
MSVAVLVLMALTVVSPAHLSFFPGWLLAAVEGILLLILVIADPGRIDREARWLHWTSVLLVAVLLASALASTALLIYDLLDDSPVTADAGSLLLAGAKVWLTNNIAFALLYWEFDNGGPVQRAKGLPDHPDLAFPQQLNPELAKPGWRPEFLDYLYVAFTTANAFSPTDTMPMAHWAKVAMASQALISFTIVGLVIARAVNAFAS